jgi:prepilin-type N-terminal cleavage/methylation domain-containing protein
VGTKTFKQANREQSQLRAKAGVAWAQTSLRRGFTLVEIVVVVTLLTVLALIAIPNFLSARKDAAKSACINNIKEISYATEQWALELKKAPTAQVTFDDIYPYMKGAVVCPTGGKTFEDSYGISIVANEPTCLRQPQDHYWLGSTTVVAIQISQSNSGGTASGLIGDGGSSGNGKGNGNGNGKGDGKGNGKGK